jgi:DNA-binding NarL/FixJ family response regulator
VVVMTTTDHAMDINNASRRRAHRYITKPSGLEAFARAIESLEKFWFKTVQLPTQ